MFTHTHRGEVKNQEQTSLTIFLSTQKAHPHVYIVVDAELVLDKYFCKTAGPVLSGGL